MALPTVPADELARRLQILYPAGPLDTQLESKVDEARDMLSGLVYGPLVSMYPALWAEAVTGLAVKLWDTGAKGAVGMGPTGEWDVPGPSATAGLVNSVAALWHPLTLTGGSVIA
jgi:hypothetical protein